MSPQEHEKKPQQQPGKSPGRGDEEERRDPNRRADPGRERDPRRQPDEEIERPDRDQEFPGRRREQSQD